MDSCNLVNGIITLKMILRSTFTVFLLSVVLLYMNFLKVNYESSTLIWIEKTSDLDIRLEKPGVTEKEQDLRSDPTWSITIWGKAEIGKSTN